MAGGSIDFVEEAVTLAEAGADRNPGVASFEGVALQVRGILTRDLDLLAQAADVLSRSPRPLLQASGYEDFGRALLSSGNRSEAVASLDRALEIYRRLGANGPGAALRQEMAAAGVRRKILPGYEEKPRSGWDALTPTEIKVAHLIGSGHTNKQTADELSVSANTVGTHVRSVFAKLGVRSRVQLANLMRDESPLARQG
jgi:DNA-binding CsgD family transcriptional regulator